MTTTQTSCDVLMHALEAHNLLAATGLDRARDYLKKGLYGPRELASFLVEQGLLTRFQTTVLLEGAVEQLQLSSYTLTDIIGTGSMGTVYRARSSRDDGQYAIKIVPRRSVINLKSIGEKVEALKQVRHPRVSAMIQVGVQGDRAYMVWPLLEGGEKLDSLVRRQGRLAPRQAAQVALQVAMGLQAYHQHDLFHGLLKPSDILVGTDRRVRILDFGVGFLLTCERGKSLLSTITNSKAMAHGLDCASPESIMDPLNRTTAGDQYSLGCIMYFCLTGRYPFLDNNPVKKMLAHQFEEPIPLDELAPECPARLEAVVYRLMRKQPDERYPFIEEAIQELQAIAPSSPSHLNVPTNRGSGRVASSRPAVPAPPKIEREVRQEVEENEVSPPEPVRSQAALAMTLVGIATGVLAGLIAWLVMR